MESMAQASWWTRATAFLRSRTDDVRPVSSDDNANSVRRLVIDTNIFIAAVRSPRSASRMLLDAVAAGRATLLISPPVFAEYRRVLPKAVQSRERERLIQHWIAQASAIEADPGPRVIAQDADDDKFVSLALAGEADAIISNDEHLLQMGDSLGVPVLRPADIVDRLDNGQGEARR